MVKRNFRENPVKPWELLYNRWYAIENDCIGGWDVSTVNLPESQRDPQFGEFEVGTFMTKEVAEHVAYVHNAWWDSVVAVSYSENLGSYFLTYCGSAGLTRTS